MRLAADHYVAPPVHLEINEDATNSLLPLI